MSVSGWKQIIKNVRCLMQFSITFLEYLFWGVVLISPILLMLGLLVIVLGLVVGRIEQWTRFDAIYWALITALTVGYGDIRPTKKSSRVLSTIIAIVGIMFTGIIVAITVKATSGAFEQHVSPAVIERINGQSG